jgi:hypothetical protein
VTHEKHARKLAPPHLWAVAQRPRLIRVTENIFEVKHINIKRVCRLLEFELFAERKMPLKEPRNVKSYFEGGEFVAAQMLERCGA